MRAGAFPASVSGFGGAGGGEALASKRRPRPDRIEIDVYAPVFASFGKSAKLLANEGQIVVSVGIVGIEEHRLTQVTACLFESADIFQDTAEIIMRQGIFLLRRKSTLEIFSGLLEISVLVIKSSAVQ